MSVLPLLRMYFFKRLLAVCFLAVTLAACNSGENFSSDSNITSPVIEGGQTSNDILDKDPSVRRVVGLIANDVLANIGYQCGDLLAYTGKFGVQRERENNYFVCPQSASSVTFFLGGDENRLELGTAYFECEPSSSEQGVCIFPLKTGAYENNNPEEPVQQPTIMLLSLSDLIVSPRRIDASDSGVEASRLVNMGGLLRSLDIAESENVIQIHDAVHQVINDNPDLAQLLSSSMEIPFDELISAGGPIDLLHDQVVASEGQVGLVPQSRLSVQNNLNQSSFRTSAGLYRLNMESAVYALFLHFLGDLVPNLFPVTDSLSSFLANASVDPVSELQDSVLNRAIGTDLEYLPYVMIDRYGRTWGGGPYDVLDVTFESDVDQQDAGDLDDLNDLSSIGLNYQCATNDAPDYFVLSEQAELGVDYNLNDFEFRSINPSIDTVINLKGRMFRGAGYHGEKRVEARADDYELIYPYQGVAPFQQTDAMKMEGVACGFVISDIIVNTFTRVGLVEPFLDERVMTDSFGPDSGPGAYDFYFSSRAGAFDEDFSDVSEIKLPVTIHKDGSIFTNVINPESRNQEYDNSPEKRIPQGERLIGMVSSVAPKEDDIPDRINVVMFVVGGGDAHQDLPHFGKRFRLQLIPQDQGECHNVFISPGSYDPEKAEKGNLGLWFDSFSPAKRAAEKQMTDQELFELARTASYGQIMGLPMGCDPEGIVDNI